MKRLICALLGLALLLAMWPSEAARADIAPPDFPPGANPLPGSEVTQVRMLSESVLIEVLEQPSPLADSMGVARTTAEFTLQNQGTDKEKMQVRFPLTFWDGSSDGFFKYPEIRDLEVQVNGIPAGTRRITTPNERDPEHPIPWAAFEVTFPSDRPVQITVRYLSDGTGEHAFVSFRYILETGAGWKDTIGSADITLRLPYEAGPENVVAEETGFGSTTLGGVFAGREVRWHYEALEPTRENNLEMVLVTPAAWRRVLRERQATAQNPRDGEAWGRLGKACKEAIMLRKGMRGDPGGLSLYQESVQAYEQALALKPNDSLWHTGYADLLWNQYYWNVYWTDPTDVRLLVSAVEHLQRALELDPKNQLAKDLLDNIGYALPEYVRHTDGGLDLLILTATPAPVTPSPSPTLTALPTDTPSPTDTPLPPTLTQAPPLATLTPTSEQAIPPTTAAATPTAPARRGLPCGSALLAPIAAGFAFVRRRRGDRG
jgi:hypothetical protein